jgi:ribonuclease D
VTDRVVELARSAGRLAIDTEFMAERRYQAMLCLAQVAVRDASGAGVETEIVDPLQDGHGDALAAALADPAVEVVVHAGRQDVAILKRVWNMPVTNLFDTQIAAGFLGYGTQESYRALVRRVLGIRIASAESFTRWDRRPLTERQLRYARQDARYLLELGEVLQERLEEAGRLEWAREECRALEQVSDQRDPHVIFRRLPGVARLNRRALSIARELVDWREEMARELDRNPGSVLPDHVLVELARQAPTRRDALHDVRGVPPATLHRHAHPLLDVIARGAQRPPPSLPKAPPPAAPEDAPLTALLGSLVRHRAVESGIAAQLIATQSELASLVAAVSREDAVGDLPVMNGWRRELVGEELLALLGGRLAVRVGDGRRLEVSPPEDPGQAAG